MMGREKEGVGASEQTDKEKTGTNAPRRARRFGNAHAAVGAETIKRAVGRLPAEDGSPTSPPRRPAQAMGPDAQRVERARQALLGSLLCGASADGGYAIKVDEKRLRDRLAAMTPAEIERMAEFLAQVRQPEGASEESTPLLDRVEDQLARRGIRFEMRGQTNNVYIAGDKPTWHVERAPEALNDDREAKPSGWKKDGRAPFRNSWGYQLGRQVKNFINGH
jgi:hypothetical protein